MSTTRSAPSLRRAYDPPKLWTTAEFDRLVDLGFIEEGCDTYLWDGQIVTPMPEYPPHYNAFVNLLELLRVLFPAMVWLVNPNAPLTLGDGTRPQPDLLVTRGPRSRYRDHSPTPADVALLVEVSASTYDRDSGERLRKYARAGIALYWIVNVKERRVEVYEQPTGDGYRVRADYGLDQSIRLDVTHDDLRVTGEIAVMDILRDSLPDDEAPARA